MDPAKERFLRNYIAIRKFVHDGEVPNKNVWDFINATADLFYNFRQKLVKEVKSNSATFRRFMRKNLTSTRRQHIFTSIQTTIKAVLIHLLNEKILHTR